MITAAMGWISTLGTIGAYAMLSRGHWHSASLRYAAVNGVGGILGASASAAYGAWPSAVANLLWAGVAAHSIIGTLRSRRARRHADVVELEDRSAGCAPAGAHQRALADAA